MRRRLNIAGALVCACLLGYAYYAQYHLGLDPCPLCIFQRVGVAAAGVLFLIAGVHHPRGWGAAVYGTLIVAAALLTLGVAVRHLWIQHLPEGAVPVCGASLEFLWQVFPKMEVIRKVLTGSGECAKVTWRLLGLSMPAWVAIAAAALAALGLYANLVVPSASRLRIAAK